MTGTTGETFQDKAKTANRFESSFSDLVMNYAEGGRERQVGFRMGVSGEKSSVTVGR